MSSLLTQVPPKKAETRIVYRIVVTEENNPDKAVSGRSRRIVCTYHNGDRVHGDANGQPHPEIVVSVQEQDEVLWTGLGHFKVALTLASDVGNPKVVTEDDEMNPFYRKDWKASRGRDGIYRLVSGPVNPEKLPKAVQYKYSVTRLKADGSEDTDCLAVDPHIILEP